jgi:hypothetical protein
MWLRHAETTPAPPANDGHAEPEAYSRHTGISGNGKRGVTATIAPDFHDPEGSGTARSTRSFAIIENYSESRLHHDGDPGEVA